MQTYVGLMVGALIGNGLESWISADPGLCHIVTECLCILVWHAAQYDTDCVQLLDPHHVFQCSENVAATRGPECMYPLLALFNTVMQNQSILKFCLIFKSQGSRFFYRIEKHFFFKKNLTFCSWHPWHLTTVAPRHYQTMQHTDSSCSRAVHLIGAAETKNTCTSINTSTMVDFFLICQGLPEKF